MRTRAATGILAVLLAGMTATAQVVLRSGERIDAKIEDASLAGLRVAAEQAGGPSRLVGWDRIKMVEGAEEAKAAPFATVMDELWRARTRVERGDYAGAEPLLLKLREVYAAEDGPCAAVVAECLYRCSLDRDARGAATAAWLWWTSIADKRGTGEKAAAWVGGTTDMPAITDAMSRLSPALPPFWAQGAATEASAASIDWMSLKSRGGFAGELAGLYEKAARFEAGLEAEVVLAAPVSVDPGMMLVRDIVLARAGDAGARASARESLSKRIAAFATRVDATSTTKAPKQPAWIEAWCRAALGRSLIREADNKSKMRGVIELLHIPARFGAEQPLLAGIALADAAVVMAEVGDGTAAAALKNELLARYPQHPSVMWDAVRKIQGGGAAAQGIGAQSRGDTGMGIGGKDGAGATDAGRGVARTNQWAADDALLQKGSS